MTAIAVYRGKNKVRDAVGIAEKFGLRVPGWALERVYRDIRRYDDNARKSKLVIAFEDDKAIAVAITTPMPYYVGMDGETLVAAFVVPEHRGKGIGSEVVKALSHTTLKRSRAGSGIDGSEKFWQTLKVDVDIY